MKIIESAFNSNPNITGYEIPVHTPEWYQFRTTGMPGIYEGGFGASECGTLTGKNNKTYGEILPVLLNKKAGITPLDRKMNEHMLSGILAEPIILERWKYYDGTDKGYLDNYMIGKVMRKHRTVDMYLVNKKYPWLFASLDAAILAGEPNLRGGQLKCDCPLEIKQISYFAAQQWESGIPPQYIYQINQQMLVTETDYCELAILQDGFNFKVDSYQMDVDICNEILEKSRDAWEQVLVMRKKHKEIKYYQDLNQMDKVEKLQSELDSMIPEPDSSDGWKEFLNERYIVEQEAFTGTTNHFRQCVKRSKAKLAMKHLEDFCDGIDNKLRAEFVRNGAEIMDFGSSGKVTYKKIGARKDPQFNYAGIKRSRDISDEETVLEIIEPLIK